VAEQRAADDAAGAGEEDAGHQSDRLDAKRLM
jgi:hypothetical protein